MLFVCGAWGKDCCWDDGVDNGWLDKLMEHGSDDVDEGAVGWDGVWDELLYKPENTEFQIKKKKINQPMKCAKI